MNIREILEKERGLEKSEIIYIICHALRQNKEQIISKIDDQIDPKEVEHIERLIRERKEGKPFAYIVGKKEFFSYEFLVNPSVLIPRPETELLVEEAEKIIERKRPRKILDMGTGSGAIGITLALRTSLPVYCVEISKQAILTAKKNSRFHRVEKKIFLLCCDLFSAIRPGTKFDLILANLPYVGEDEWENLPVEVSFYEPKQALFGGKRGLEIIDRFLKNVEHYVYPEGNLLLEIGGRDQGETLRALLSEKGFDVEVLKDYSGIDRVIRATWKSSS